MIFKQLKCGNDTLMILTVSHTTFHSPLSCDFEICMYRRLRVYESVYVLIHQYKVNSIAPLHIDTLNWFKIDKNGRKRLGYLWWWSYWVVVKINLLQPHLSLSWKIEWMLNHGHLDFLLFIGLLVFLVRYNGLAFLNTNLFLK